MRKYSLVADDSHVIRRIASTLLGALDFQASEADSLGATLTACATRMPFLVILDWRMKADGKHPMDSLECVQTLRRLPGGEEPVVLYCTTEHDPKEYDRALKAGADDVIVKPYDRDMLHRKLIAAGLM